MSDITNSNAAAATISTDAIELGLLPPVALVVGSMIGSGDFNLLRDMSAAAGPAANVIGWTIISVGMLALAVVYQGLATRKPMLNAGHCGAVVPADDRDPICAWVGAISPI